MTRKLFELVGTDPTRPFSPYVWRIRLALAHKGLEVERIPWRFTEKEAIAPYKTIRVPVLLDGETSIFESFDIASYLETTYPDRPSLFGGETGRAVTRLINNWADSVIVMGLFPVLAADIVKLLAPKDAAYYRETREKRLGMTLEKSADRCDAVIEDFRRALEPLRLTLQSQPFIAGDAPNYADYIAFGPFQWARAVSPVKLLKGDDPVFAWREKMLDAFGGMARQSPGFPV